MSLNGDRKNDGDSNNHGSGQCRRELGAAGQGLERANVVITDIREAWLIFGAYQRAMIEWSGVNRGTKVGKKVHLQLRVADGRVNVHLRRPGA